MDNTPPSKNMPTQPTGEFSINSRKFIGLVRPKAGVGPIDNKIAAKEIETNIETIKKGRIRLGQPVQVYPALQQYLPFVKSYKVIKPYRGFHLMHHCLARFPQPNKHHRNKNHGSTSNNQNIGSVKS